MMNVCTCGHPTDRHIGAGCIEYVPITNELKAFCTCKLDEQEAVEASENQANQLAAAQAHIRELEAALGDILNAMPNKLTLPLTIQIAEIARAALKG